MPSRICATHVNKFSAGQNEAATATHVGINFREHTQMRIGQHDTISSTATQLRELEDRLKADDLNPPLDSHRWSSLLDRHYKLGTSQRRPIATRGEDAGGPATSLPCNA